MPEPKTTQPKPPRHPLHVALVTMVLLWRTVTSSAAEGGGLTAQWDFDRGLTEACGEQKDTLVAADTQGRAGRPRYVSANEVPGVVGRAVALGVRRGDASYLTAPVSRDLRLPAGYTIEAWVQPTHVGGWGRLALRWGGPGKYAYHFALHDGRVSLYHGQADGTYVFAEGGHVRPGQWYHIAGVARRNDADPAHSTLTVYLNGRPVGAGVYDGTSHPAGTEGLGVGDAVSIPGAGSRFRGYLDELSLWSRSLDAGEIAAHYQQRRDVLSRLAAARRKAELARRAGLVDRLDHLGVEEIVFAERHPGRDPSGHYYANFGYSCIDPNYWIHGADGGRLCKLNLRTGELTVLLDDPRGAVRDPRVHFDAKRILFSYRKGGTHQYHLYEIHADGTGLRQITDGPWDDVEPDYLPDGDIVFCSTRCNRYIGCWLAPSATLHRCRPDGTGLRRLSSGSFTENTPAVLPDGRVLYTRWEYVNRDAVSFHHLWTMNPDGSGTMVYFGNERPGGVFIDAEGIPGTDRIVMILSPGHGRNEHVGQVVTLDVRRGPNDRSDMRPVSPRADCRDPYPLSPDTFLVARGSQILLMDATGHADVLHTAGMMVHEPRPLRRRPRPRVIGPRSEAASHVGRLALADVYVGRQMAGVRPGAVKKLLVLEDLPKPANYHGGGSQPIGHGVTSTLKRILGTVPVEPDGSAYFEAPPLRSLYVALLDENDLSIKQMRSFLTLQPGETLGCVGCHERRTRTMSPGHRPLAMRREPSRIRPIEGAPDVVDFPRDVQPVLDKHCIRCHNAADRKGGVVLSGDHGPVFSISYYELLLHWQVKDTAGAPASGTGRQPGHDAPYSTYSSASPLMKKVDTHHNKVHLSERERDLIRLWIDTNTQYAGTYAAYGTGQVGGCWGNNRPVRVMADRWPSTPPAVAAMKRRCSPCHSPRQLPYHVTARIAADHGDMLSWTRPLSRYSRHHVFNLTQPAKSLVLLAPLAKAAGGYAAGTRKPGAVRENRRQPPKPVVHPVIFRDTRDADYRAILTHLQAARAKLDEIKRFDMPGFVPSEHYLREMQRFGILPPGLDPRKRPVDVYATDRAYWRSMWYKPGR